MPRTSLRWKLAAQRAREGRQRIAEQRYSHCNTNPDNETHDAPLVSESESSINIQDTSSPIEVDLTIDEDIFSDIECTKWTGGVNHIVLSDSESDDGSDFEDDSDYNGESEEEFSELEGEELIESLRCQAEKELELLKNPNAVSKMRNQGNPLLCTTDS
jgi:hypothetical protein